MRLSFCASNLKVTRCDDTADAAAHYASGVGTELTPPLSRASAAELGALVMRKRIELELSPMDVAADVSISGLGWVAVGALASLRAPASPGAMRVVIDVWVPQGVEVSLRRPMPVGGLPVDVSAAASGADGWEELGVAGQR